MVIFGVPYSGPSTSWFSLLGCLRLEQPRWTVWQGLRELREHCFAPPSALFISLHNKMLRLAGQGHSFHCVKWEAQGWERCEFLVQVPTARAEIKSHIAYPHTQCYFYYGTITTWFSRDATDASLWGLLPSPDSPWSQGPEWVEWPAKALLPVACSTLGRSRRAQRSAPLSFPTCWETLFNTE